MSMQQLVNAQANGEVPVNENFETLEHVACYGKRHTVTSGLTWGYYGGRWGGFSVADGTLTLTNTATNYIVVLRSSGVISVSTTTTNWNNVSAYARVYLLTVAGGVVTATQDHRAGLYGVHGSRAVGRQAIWIPALDMTPSVSGGCAVLATIASASGQPDMQTLDFDASTVETAQFSLMMPKRWDLGTVTFVPVWSHPATTTNFGVVWQLQAVAVSNDDTIFANFGTVQASTDTGGTTSDLYMGPESSAITVAGTPAVEDCVFFRVWRLATSGSDTLAVDARLHGIVLYVNTTAENDQ